MKCKVKFFTKKSHTRGAITREPLELLREKVAAAEDEEGPHRLPCLERLCQRGPVQGISKPLVTEKKKPDGSMKNGAFSSVQRGGGDG